MISKSQMVFLEHSPFASHWSCRGRKPKDNRRLNVSYGCRSLLLIAVTDLRYLLSVSGPDSPVLFADLGCVLSTRNKRKRATGCSHIHAGLSMQKANVPCYTNFPNSRDRVGSTSMI